MQTNLTGSDNDSPLTARQVAALFNVSSSAVAKWADAGKLRSFRTPGGHRRFRREDVNAFIASSEVHIEVVPS